MGLLEKDKRKFSVIIGSKKCGTCSGTSPSLAAKKVKGKSGEFYLKETTKGSKKKLYGPYSSKKRIVQRGGTLKESIIENVLNILNNCDDLHVFTNELNIKYKILENTYLFLGISLRKDKCKILKELLGLRSIYSIKNQDFPLDFCLSKKNQFEHNLIESGFYIKYHDLILSKVGEVGSKIYYENNWSKFINFLRRTILQIEIEILEQSRKNNIKLGQIKEELNKETQNKLNEMKREIEEAKSLYAAQAGPAKERPLTKPSQYLLTNNELRELGINPNGSSLANPPTNLSQIPPSMLQAVGRRRNLNTIQPPHNNQNPSNMSNLEARLAAALRNNNNPQQNPPALTTNLHARLQAALNND